MLCYAAMSDLFKYLPQSKIHPESVEIRQKLQVAEWMSLWPLKFEKYRFVFENTAKIFELTMISALGISHALGHKLGARYSIGHGITSCLTLAPTVLYQAEAASPDHKQYLADSLFYLREPSTGDIDEDIRHLAKLINK